METSKSGIYFIAQHEGCSLKAYFCPAGVLTIGFGHEIDKEDNLTKDSLITLEESNNFLKKDIKSVENFINNIIKENNLSLKQNEFDPLVSLIFNIGEYRFSKYLCFYYIKKHEFKKCLIEWSDIVKSNGSVIKGLVKRRIDEIEMFNGDYNYLNKDELHSLFKKWLTY